MFTLGLITVCMPMASVLALAFLIPILAQMGLGENALKASFILLPGTLLSGLLAPFMGAKYAKFGVRRLIIPGFIIMSLAMIYLLLVEVSFSTTLIGYICFMTGAAFCQVPAQTNALNALPQKYNADGIAILSTLQQTAGAAGTGRPCPKPPPTPPRTRPGCQSFLKLSSEIHLSSLGGSVMV